MSIKLTAYSHGAGCGCKLSPGVLSELLRSDQQSPAFSHLLVGNEHRDDAAVVDLNGETAIVSTTDFFMPIVDDPYDFGAIAATNALSDVYAMGAEPIMAIAILGWPIDKIPPKVAAEVLRGGREVCHKAGIPMAGGHSIDAPEPIFGLAVTGKAPISRIKKNKGARAGDLIFLTKPLGIGVVTTAQKRGLAQDQDLELARKSMLALNDIGMELGKLEAVHALTDVTGFGLAGHLLEVCEASGVSATLQADRIPVFDFSGTYLEQGCVPGGTHRNWETYGDKVLHNGKMDHRLLADPQTSGGLLVIADPFNSEQVLTVLRNHGLKEEPIGTIISGTPSPMIQII